MSFRALFSRKKAARSRGPQERPGPPAETGPVEDLEGATRDPEGGSALVADRILAVADEITTRPGDVEEAHPGTVPDAEARTQRFLRVAVPPIGPEHATPVPRERAVIHPEDDVVSLLQEAPAPAAASRSTVRRT